MTPRQKKRFFFVASIIVGLSLATFLGLKAIKESANYFVQPTDIVNGNIDLSKKYRIGGIVKANSVKRQGVDVEFQITDCTHDVMVTFTGILPDLFREGQGIVANGALEEHNGSIRFAATQVLAKHDENYVPSESANAMMLKQADQCDPKPETSPKAKSTIQPTTQPEKAA